MRLTLLISLILGSPLIAQESIHIAFHNGQTTVNAMVSRPDGGITKTSTDTWNNPSNNGGEGMSFTGFALADRSGAPTGALLAATSGYTGYNSNGWSGATQDSVMMEGWYGFRSNESIEISNLPAGIAAEYSVIIYGDSNDNNRTMNYTVTAGGVSDTKTIQDSSLFDGTFEEGRDVVSFSGLSGNILTIKGNPESGDARSAVGGLVILPGSLPEPPKIVSFETSGHYVSPGENVTLSWQVTGADSVSISPAPGDVTGSTTAGVTVSETTTYTLTATNGDGSSTATLRVGAGPPRPNIVFFLVDDMGWQDTSVPFYHDAAGDPIITPLNQRYRTPSMELLAARGMKFTNAYAMPVCTPSRVCWMTGQNSVRHHVTNWTNPSGTDNDQNSTTSHNSPGAWESGGLPESLTTLPALLQSNGYRTIHAGKAHFGATTYSRKPENVGFDVNIAGSEIGHPGSYTGDYGQSSNRPVPGLEAYHNSGTFLTEALTLEFNKAIEEASNDGVPFFGYMAHYAVHSPFQTDPRFAANYPGLSGGPLSYATMIEGMDKSLGDIITKLESLGIADDTLIVFMSDNGGDAPLGDVNNSNAPLRHKKGSQYEGGVREPLIVSWAQRDAANPFQSALPIPAASREDDIVAVFDLFPTFASVGGAAFSQTVDGHDLSPYLRGESGSHRPQELLIYYPHDHRGDYFTIFREGDWKLIHTFADNKYELYNLADDISEATDLSAGEPERVLRMARKTARQMNAAGAQWPRFASGGADDPLSVPVIAGVDSDADGLEDSEEDPNANGLVDPGETDPDNVNSDGDHTSDGAEIKTGTDPLNASSDFQVKGFSRDLADGSVFVAWPSAPGAVYRLEVSTTLGASWDLLRDDVPAAATGDTTSLEISAPEDPSPRLFYRAVLK